MFSANKYRRPTFLQPLRGLASVAAAASLLAIVWSLPAAADLGPCNTAAPTTREVLLLVSDVDRASRWYQDNVGLLEERRWTDPRFGNATVVQLGLNQTGVTLVPAPQLRGGFREPQAVCLVLNGPPAPTVASGTTYLVDPDGTSVELPPFAGNLP